MFGRYQPLPASTAPTNPEIHFVAHDASSPEAEWKGHILLASILRKTIFHDELGLPEAEYEHSHEDVKWRHVFTRSTFSRPPFGVLCVPAQSHTHWTFAQRETRRWRTSDGTFTATNAQAGPLSACWTCCVSRRGTAGSTLRSA